MHVGRPCKAIPRRYRATTQDFVESSRDNDFVSRVARFHSDLPLHLNHKIRGRVPDDDNARASWSVNGNLSRLVNTLRARIGWQLLPAGEEEVEEGLFWADV